MEHSSPKGSTSGWQSRAWSLGSFVKTIASKSEEVLQVYQRDLQEFGIGLKKETAAAAEITAHVVKDLPVSLETSAVVAQESLEAVGQTLEDFGSSVWRGTAEILAQVKEAVQNVDDNSASISTYSTPTIGSGRYSRYEAQVNTMQCDSSTYCDEPMDQEDFAVWKSTFDIDERKEEIHAIVKDNSFVGEIQARLVPSTIGYDTFWSRYFYRLNKLQQVEDARADIVKRATSKEEEDLTWEVDEEVDNSKLHDIPLEITEETASSSVQVDDVQTEDEVKSDNSNSSEWLVVQEEQDPATLNSKIPTSPDTSVDSDHDIAQVEKLAGLLLGDQSMKEDIKKENTRLQSHRVESSMDEKEEDWGAWE